MQSEHKAPHILNLSSNWKSMVSFMFQPCYTHYPLDRMLGGLQTLSGYISEEKYSCPCWILNCSHLICNWSLY
jgi:hypothetical protein